MTNKTDPASAALLFFDAISTEAWGRDLPTVRLANLIAGEESALDQPVTEPGTSGSAEVDAIRAAHIHVLSAAHAYAAAEQARKAAKAERDQLAGDPSKVTARFLNSPEGSAANAAWLAADDTAYDAHRALMRAARALEPRESKFDVTGAP